MGATSAAQAGSDWQEQMVIVSSADIANCETLTGVIAICRLLQKKFKKVNVGANRKAYIRDRSQVEFSHTM